MQAVYLENRRARLIDTREPRRKANEASIRLMLGGICNTDIELLRGYYGFSGIPGHEFVGEVLAAADQTLIGKRVVGEINLACGQCDWCRRGLGRHCPKRSVLGIVRHPGAFREILTLPEVNLHVVPDSVPTEAAVFTEPLAAACEILDQATIPAGSEVAVLGDGKLGLLVSQVLHANGHRVIQYGRHRNKLRIAAKAGVTTEIRPAKLPVAKFDWVVEATGSPEGLRQAVEMTRPRGTVFMKSTVHGSVRIDTAPVIVNEITLVGSRCGRFEPALKLLETGRINVEDMIAAEEPLAAAAHAFRLAQRSGVMKVLLRP
ncbi:MAG TPA: alcohol dehydrogenase catalytic domain-containing protein [Terriglobia bacterium]|nr:alcohol dehydrogenase catalytic domain-containing protein [Terriglobia bacterium]